MSDHRKWVKDIEETQGHAVNYPLIGDTELKIAKLYDMLPEDDDPSQAARLPITPPSDIIAPDKKIKAMLTYPMSTGRNFDEVMRIVDSCQLTAKHKVSTPVNWKQMDKRVSELDPDKLTIVYCAAGLRSRAAASILQEAGFPEVYSMSGGIKAWSGLVAEGLPEAGISWFSAARSVDEQTALAWVLADGTERFMKKWRKPRPTRMRQPFSANLSRLRRGTRRCSPGCCAAFPKLPEKPI